MSDLNPIRTPCVGVCSTGIGDAVCRGCKRFAHEVIDWNGYSQAQKQAIDARLDRFLALCVANKLRIVDQNLLDWQLSVQKIRHQPHHDPYCHLFALLKAGATQISQPEQYGFEVLPSCRDMTLVALRDQIDEEFWILSSAHYDRYIATGDWQGKAGGYAIQGPAAALIRHIEGSYSNIVGFSLYDIAAMLRGNGLLR